MNLLAENSVKSYNNIPVRTPRKCLLPIFQKKEPTEAEQQNNILKKRTKIAWGYVLSLFAATNIMYFAIKKSAEGVNIFKEIPKTIRTKQKRFATTKNGMKLLEQYEINLENYPKKSVKYKLTKLAKFVLFGPDGGPSRVKLYTLKEMEDVAKGILPSPDSF